MSAKDSPASAPRRRWFQTAGVAISVTSVLVSTYMAYLATRAASFDQLSGSSLPTLVFADDGSWGSSSGTYYCQQYVRLYNLGGVSAHLNDVEVEMTLAGESFVLESPFGSSFEADDIGLENAPSIFDSAGFNLLDPDLLGHRGSIPGQGEEAARVVLPAELAGHIPRDWLVHTFFQVSVSDDSFVEFLYPGQRPVESVDMVPLSVRITFGFADGQAVSTPPLVCRYLRADALRP